MGALPAESPKNKKKNEKGNGSRGQKKKGNRHGLCTESSEKETEWEN